MMNQFGNHFSKLREKYTPHYATYYIKTHNFNPEQSGILD